MKILEKGPSYEVRANEEGTEVEIERDPRVQRGALTETMNLMSKGVWVAYALDEREDGTLYERWVKHPAPTEG